MSSDSRFTPSVLFFGGGVLLILLQLLIAWVSQRFHYGVAAPPGAILLFVLLQIGAGLIYLAVIASARRAGDAPAPLFAIVVVGILLRAIAWVSQPVLEDDFYRYLWDGAALSAGVSPYRYPPAEILQGASGPPERLRMAAVSGGPVVARINHPELVTIYPPVAQAGFLIAHIISPFSLDAWRAVLLLADLAALMLLLRVLKSLPVPLGLISVYWWNPLFIKETYNTGHMDVLVLPFLLGAVLLRIRDRPFGTAILLALATGVKLWPALLAPLFLGRYVRRWGPQSIAFLVYVALCAALLAPMLTGSRESSGLMRFAERWEMNDGLFVALAWLARVTNLSGSATIRIVLGAVLAGMAGYFAFRETESPSALVRAALWVVATLLLVSPAQFPWYFTWILPLLAAVPFAPLLALTATLPMYYLRFHFAAAGDARTFDNVVVFLEWVPVWGLLLRALVKRVRSNVRRELAEQT